MHIPKGMLCDPQYHCLSLHWQFFLSQSLCMLLPRVLKWIQSSLKTSIEIKLDSKNGLSRRDIKLFI